MTSASIQRFAQKIAALGGKPSVYLGKAGPHGLSPRTCMEDFLDQTPKQQRIFRAFESATHTFQGPNSPVIFSPGLLFHWGQNWGRSRFLEGLEKSENRAGNGRFFTRIPWVYGFFDGPNISPRSGIFLAAIQTETFNRLLIAGDARLRILIHRPPSKVKKPTVCFEPYPEILTPLSKADIVQRWHFNPAHAGIPLLPPPQTPTSLAEYLWGDSPIRPLISQFHWLETIPHFEKRDSHANC